MLTDFDGAFVVAADISGRLVAAERVRAQWNEPSVLPEMTVGMLACHLAHQTSRTAELLPGVSTEEPLAERLAEVDEHYRRAAWVTATDLDDPAHDRSEEESEAALGYDAMLDRFAAARARAGELLASPGVREVVDIPWQGWSLRGDDFLLTRMLEIVTHVDDLARSIGTPTPDFPAPVYRPVVHLLARLAAERHGQAALTSALTRRERMPTSISAF